MLFLGKEARHEGPTDEGISHMIYDMVQPRAGVGEVSATGNAKAKHRSLLFRHIMKSHLWRGQTNADQTTTKPETPIYFYPSQIAGFSWCDANGSSKIR
jgi:hypothetical protein